MAQNFLKHAIKLRQNGMNFPARGGGTSNKKSTGVLMSDIWI